MFRLILTTALIYTHDVIASNVLFAITMCGQSIAARLIAGDLIIQ